jgi:hypothetical protein
MKLKILILIIVLSATWNIYAQQSKSTEQIRKEWLHQEKLKHFVFLKNYKTTDYVCETKIYSKLIFDRQKNIWINDTNGDSYKKQREFFKILKSDDIKTEIPWCGAEDKPLSRDSKLNKYFCIINDHPKQDYSTHYKCLLNIENDIGKDKHTHVLECGEDKSLKFVFEGSKFFNNINNKVSDYEFKGANFDRALTYSQTSLAGDCLKVSNWLKINRCV